VGGFGSGRYGFSSAGTCESRHSIDLAWLRRRGIVDPGWIGGRTTLAWSLGGEKSGSIGVLAQADGLRLMYGVTLTMAPRSASTSSSRLLTRRPGSAAGGNG